MGWFEIKRSLLILYVLLITVGIYAIGVGSTRYKKNEIKFTLLAKQYRQKQKANYIKLSSENLNQGINEAKIAFDKANQAEAASLALIAENKAKQEEAEVYAKSKLSSAKTEQETVKVDKTPIITAADKAKIEAAKIEVDRLAKIEVDRLAKIESDKAAKKEADLIKEEADKEALAAEQHRKGDRHL